MIYALYVIYVGILWRLRGGAWATFFGLNMGTNVTRLLTGVLIAVPLVVFGAGSTQIVALAVAVVVGLMVAGWGPYMNFGPTTQTSWIDFFPYLLSLTLGTADWCLAGMFSCGMIVFGFDYVAIASTDTPASWGIASLYVVAAAGLFALEYYAVNMFRQLPSIKGFASNHCEWSELVAGMLVGLSLLMFKFG